MGIRLLSLSVITAGAAEAQRAKETNSDMIKEEKMGNESISLHLQRIWTGKNLSDAAQTLTHF